MQAPTSVAIQAGSQRQGEGRQDHDRDLDHAEQQDTAQSLPEGGLPRRLDVVVQASGGHVTRDAFDANHSGFPMKTGKDRHSMT